MIKELFLYLTTKSSKVAKQSGLLYESIAIGERAKRNQSYWTKHWDLCHKNILKQIEFYKKNKFAKNSMQLEASTDFSKPLDTCAIIGSAYLHEIPVDQLLEKFNQIILIDMVHPKEVKNKFLNNSKVKFIEADISQCLALKSEKDILNHQIQVPEFLQNADVVISANLLSQIPRAFAQKYNQAVLYKLQKDHIDLLKACRAKLTIVFFDYEFNVYDRDHKFVQSETTVPKNLIQNKIDNWTWHYAPLGEIDSKYSFEMQVAFCVF